MLSEQVHYYLTLRRPIKCENRQQTMKMWNRKWTKFNQNSSLQVKCFHAHWVNAPSAVVVPRSDVVVERAVKVMKEIKIMSKTINIFTVTVKFRIVT